MILFALFACGEKETDTAVEPNVSEVGDTGDDTGEESSEGSEGSGGSEGTGTNTDSTWTVDALAELTQSGGCSDYFVYLKNPEDTLTIHISGSGLAMEAHESDRGVAEHIYTVDPSTDDIQPSVVAQSGEHLNEFSCNDAIMNEPVVDSSYSAISGTVHVTVVADGEMTDWGETPANISIEFNNVCFDSPEPFCIETLSISEYIGWLPG